MPYATSKICIGNIDAQKMIVNQIHFHQRQVEYLTEDYDKACLNHDYKTIQESNNNRLMNIGSIAALEYALRAIVAQEASASGRQVSASLSEFDSVVEEMINGRG